MIQFPNYRAATNYAYKLIAEREHFSLSANVFSMAENLPKCRLFTYGQAVLLYGANRDALLASSEYGYTVTDGTHRIIYYNENLPLSCIRFTIAHEIGHAVLGHKDEDDPVAEKEANCFARNLLCPIPVVTALRLESANDYVSAFNVSGQMAQVAIDRRKSDEFYIDSFFLEIINDKLYAYNLGYESLSEYERYLFA